MDKQEQALGDRAMAASTVDELGSAMAGIAEFQRQGAAGADSVPALDEIESMVAALEDADQLAVDIGKLLASIDAARPHMSRLAAGVGADDAPLDELQAVIDRQAQKIEELVQQCHKSFITENERRELWRLTAVAASHQFLDEKQPARVADAVLDAFDERWGTPVAVVCAHPKHLIQALFDGRMQCNGCGLEVKVEKPKDPVDSILSAFGVDRVEVDAL